MYLRRSGAIAEADARCRRPERQGNAAAITRFDKGVICWETKLAIVSLARLGRVISRL